MKIKIIIATCLLSASTALAQFTPYGLGLVQQPNAFSARHYLGIGGLGITNTQTGVTLGGTFSGTFNSTLNGIIKGNGTTLGTVTIGAGLNYVGGVLSTLAGGGTVTTFSSGNLSPLFTTSVANAATTPALSFAQVSQNANLFFASPNGAPGNPTFRSIVAADVPALPYVTSVGLSLPASVFSVTVSPITTAGTLTAIFQTQTSNTVFAGPVSGVPAIPTFRALGPRDLGAFTNHGDVSGSPLSPGEIEAWDGSKWTNGLPAGGGGSGTVTSFSSGNLSPLFTTSVANPSTTPALSFAQVSQGSNLVFASPDGVPGNPAFRSLVAADIPALSYATSVALALPVSVFSISGSPVTGAGTLTGSFQAQTSNTFFAGPISGVAATPTFRALTPRDLGSFTNHGDVVNTTLQPGDIMAYSGSTWTNGQPSTNGTGGGGVSLPGLLVRPVQAAPGGVVSAPQWPDDTTYYFDEEFDTYTGTTGGQFGRYRWAVTVAGGGGGVINVASNSPPHYGIMEIQSPTTAGNTAFITSYGSTGLLPYGQLRTTPNWLIHAVFLLHVTNAGSVFRIGMIDSGYQSALGNSPSNCLWLRWDKRTSDGEFFSFEARRDGVIQTNASSIKVAFDTWYSVTMYSTNAATVLCQVNNESPVTMTNMTDVSMCLCAEAQGASVASRLWIDRFSFMASGMAR